MIEGSDNYPDTGVHLTAALTAEVTVVGHPTRSALTFEVAIGTVAVHARRLVAREQRAGAGEVEVRVR